VRVNSDVEDVLEDDTLSQFSDIATPDMQDQSFSLLEINLSRDETYGRQSVEITDFFPDVDKFISSVL